MLPMTQAVMMILRALPRKNAFGCQSIDDIEPTRPKDGLSTQVQHAI